MPILSVFMPRNLEEMLAVAKIRKRNLRQDIRRLGGEVESSNTDTDSDSDSSTDSSTDDGSNVLISPAPSAPQQRAPRVPLVLPANKHPTRKQKQSAAPKYIFI